MRLSAILFRGGGARHPSTDKGLLAGRKLGSGNNISSQGNRNRRRFFPNLQHANLYSEILNKKIKLLVSTFALRRIDCKGGLDNYLLEMKPEHYNDSIKARKLRECILLKKLENEKNEKNVDFNPA